MKYDHSLLLLHCPPECPFKSSEVIQTCLSVRAIAELQSDTQKSDILLLLRADMADGQLNFVLFLNYLQKESLLLYHCCLTEVFYKHIWSRPTRFVRFLEMRKKVNRKLFCLYRSAAVHFSFILFMQLLHPPTVTFPNTSSYFRCRNSLFFKTVEQDKQASSHTPTCCLFSLE